MGCLTWVHGFFSLQKLGILSLLTRIIFSILTFFGELSLDILCGKEYWELSDSKVNTLSNLSRGESCLVSLIL